jgi:hypothetical protein
MKKQQVLIVSEIGSDKRLEIVDSGFDGKLDLSPKEFEAFCERLYKGFHGIPKEVN